MDAFGIPAGILVGDTDLKPLQARSMFRRIGYEQPPADDKMLRHADCFKVWTFMLIQRLKILDSEQREFLFDSMLPSLDRLSPILLEHQPGLPVLMLGDGRYATWTFHEGWLDLLDGKEVIEPAQPVMETLGYNLATMFYRNQQACAELFRRAQANNEPGDEPEG